MTVLVWIGVAMTCAGLGGIVWCVIAVRRARAARLDDTAMRTRLHQLVAVNLGSLAVAVLGLMTMILGLHLG